MDARIWPGPECLRTENERKADEYYAHVRAGMSPSQAYALTEIDSVIRMGDAAMRVIAIGEGRAKAARRMRRFVAWMHDHGLLQAGRDADRHMSPEATVLAAAEAGKPWPFYCVGGEWPACFWRSEPYTEQDVARKLFASPEWASLPWQREP